MGSNYFAKVQYGALFLAHKFTCGCPHRHILAANTGHGPRIPMKICKPIWPVSLSRNAWNVMRDDLTFYASRPSLLQLTLVARSSVQTKRISSQ